ncbi:unnamed protein product [Mytilus coruscus]|uniref:Uncharacterized protein n=1 Tax=Mytilus coruscus TaxID=42192 RepID=A0A6J8EJH2_MYTCO|nr:unnamed protein product [Mytilus coruscus]
MSISEENEDIKTRNRELEESVNRLKENEELHKKKTEDTMNRLKIATDINAALQTKNNELAETTNRLKGENEVLLKKIREHPVDRFNQLAKNLLSLITDQGEDSKVAAENTFLTLLAVFTVLAELAVLAGLVELVVLAGLAVVRRYGQGDYMGSALEYDFLKVQEKVLKNGTS